MFDRYLQPTLAVIRFVGRFAGATMSSGKPELARDAQPRGCSIAEELATARGSEGRRRHGAMFAGPVVLSTFSAVVQMKEAYGSNPEQTTAAPG